MQAITAILHFHGWKNPDSLADPHCSQVYFAIKRQILDSRCGGYKNECLYTVKCLTIFSHAELQRVVI